MQEVSAEQLAAEVELVVDRGLAAGRRMVAGFVRKVEMVVEADSEAAAGSFVLVAGKTGKVLRKSPVRYQIVYFLMVFADHAVEVERSYLHKIQIG